MDVLKTIVPAAGQGTRFFPYTKSVPKEMLPILDKPAMHYIAEEAMASGINKLCIVTGNNKSSIDDYFNWSIGWRDYIYEKNKQKVFAGWQKIVESMQFTYVKQQEPLGLGHAIWSARDLIYKEYFGVSLPDDLIISKTPALLQLLRVARQEKASVIAVQEVPRSLVSSYGVIEIRKQITPNLFQVGNLIEKPDSKQAPSNLAIIGRYILSHKVMTALDDLKDHTESDELQLTDGIAQMIRKGEKLFAYKISGMRYDIGTPLGWIKAIIGIASQDPRYSGQVREFISTLDSVNSFVYNNSKALEQLK